MEECVLEYWAIVQRPGFPGPSLFGYLKNHPRREAGGHLADGHRAVTSDIVEASGTAVKTFSGTQYRLGEPHPAWLEHLCSGEYVNAYNHQEPVNDLQKSMAVPAAEAMSWPRIELE